MKYRIYIEQDEDGMFVVTCPALPGCVSQGRTREAISLYLESLRDHGKPVPPGVGQEIIEAPPA